MRKQFKKVKYLLRSHYNWMKGNYNNRHGRYCLLGAIERCYSTYEKEMEVQDKIMSYLVDHYDYGSIEDFNDDPRTTFKDVRRVIEKVNV